MPVTYSMKDLMLSVNVHIKPLADEANYDAILGYASQDANQRLSRAESCIEKLRELRSQINLTLERAEHTMRANREAA